MSKKCKNKIKELKRENKNLKAEIGRLHTFEDDLLSYEKFIQTNEFEELAKAYESQTTSVDAKCENDDYLKELLGGF